MRQEFHSQDEGKSVVTKDGETVGTVERIAEGEAHVRPDSGLTASIRQKLDMGDDEEEMFALTDDRVEEIDDEQVRLSDRA